MSRTARFHRAPYRNISSVDVDFSPRSGAFDLDRQWERQKEKLLGCVGQRAWNKFTPNMEPVMKPDFRVIARRSVQTQSLLESTLLFRQEGPPLTVKFYGAGVDPVCLSRSLLHRISLNRLPDISNWSSTTGSYPDMLLQRLRGPTTGF
jgi:hypothetical protein